MRLSKMLFLIMVFGIIVESPVYAGITTIQALSFGSFIVKNNNAQYDITVNTNGSYTFDAAGFIEIAPPQEGIFDLDGMTPLNSVTSVTVTQTIPLSGGGEGFQMVNLQESHTTIVNLAGEIRVTVGGTARTSGNGNPYMDQTYNGQLEIQINF